MATIPHDRAARFRRDALVDARYMWSSLAIAAMWVAVVFALAFGPDMKTQGADGSGAIIPSGMIVALLALFGTISIARHGLRNTEPR